MDIYDREVVRLSANPAGIPLAWCYGKDHSPLFDPVGHVRPGGSTYGSLGIGCLTQIRAGGNCNVAELQKAIRKDNRIPKNYVDITVENLPVFAEWQRKVDVELNREVPKLPWEEPEISTVS